MMDPETFDALHEYEERLALAALARVSAQPATPAAVVDLACAIAMESGASPMHVRGVTTKLVLALPNLFPEHVRRSIQGVMMLHNVVSVPIPRPPRLPARPMAQRRARAGRRLHSAESVTAQHLLAPLVAVAPAGDEAVREFAEAAMRLLMRTARDIQELRRKYRVEEK